MTAIENGLNLGPISGGELRSIGIDTVEGLSLMGWEEALMGLVEFYPHRLNAMMAYALWGAIEGVNFQRIPKVDREAIKRAVSVMRKRLSS